MKTIFGWFFTTLLGTFISFIVFFNLYIYIIETYGVQYNILGVPLENFRGGYFGFTSFFNALKNFPTNVVSMITQSIFDTTNALTGGVAQFLASWGKINELQVTEIFKLIATMIVQPLYLIVVVIEDIAILFYCISEVVMWVFLILGGNYNVESGHTYPYPYIETIKYLYSVLI